MAKLQNIDLINEMIEQKYICKRKHPEADLWIYNYSAFCQIDHKWNEATCNCRGIICDADNNIVARPFVKFFNYEELDDKSIVPDLPFEAYEKLDGSLGIMYWIGDVPYIATRGSFESDQAKHATYILHKNYSHYFNKLDKTKTYLFEIIWNEDHHCISYGDTDDIFLLAVIDTETGVDEDIYKWDGIFKCTKRYDGVTDFHKIREMFSGDNREGFVIKFSNGFRIKLKYEEYFRIHFVKSMLSEASIFNFVMNEKLGNPQVENVHEIIAKLDEENRLYYQSIVDRFDKLYNDIETYCKDWFAITLGMSEREIIEAIKNDKYKGILFKMWRKQDYSRAIWDCIKRNKLYKNESNKSE